MPSLATLRVFLDSLEEGVLFLDADRRVLEMNSAAGRMIGRDNQRVIDGLCPTLFSGTECARACEDRGRCSLTPAAGEDDKVQDIVLKTPAGLDMPLRMWAMLLPPNDSGLYCAIILRDRSREVELEAEVRDRWQLGGLTGRSRPMQELYQKVLRVAASDANVLIRGESGVGKELVARALHDNSARAKGPYVAVHCASLPESLQESELFGHAKGSFSGATGMRVGRFEAANGGTLLLDEIGEISPATQTRLLRVLQEREVVRVGENHPRKVDVRVVAATHRDLADMVTRGEFREDLYYRLHVLPLHVPALRERREDIALLASTLLHELAERYGRPDLRLSPEAITEMESFSWPGNVRQLFNSLEYAVVNSDGSLILPRHLPPETSIAAPDRRAAPRPTTRYYTSPATDGDERREILRVLAESGGNRAEAARRLGMSRTTLWKRLNQM
ncbi:sigma-54 interaction domain-containing protein [Aromatoleum petrolei]|uniref:AAA domain-containing protein n=1 Tax=Aromatoleum petrolei TaxID=76116 RepID=A0ABX1MXH0_9RHOO|nr:sigma 54-interacting transcriptional regulator [Aromatoleum petrolei]NMF91035.1 AAA domain-containing protein [Aromatoleum petrolei]QTQ35926.1 PAS modulated transcriptional regulator, sigma-54-specific (Fis-type) [Aromatoleum petrolei]